MSLNKFTDPNTYNPWMNINCNQLTCQNLQAPLKDYRAFAYVAYIGDVISVPITIAPASIQIFNFQTGPWNMEISGGYSINVEYPSYYKIKFIMSCNQIEQTNVNLTYTIKISNSPDIKGIVTLQQGAWTSFSLEHCTELSTNQYIEIALNTSSNININVASATFSVSDLTGLE